LIRKFFELPGSVYGVAHKYLLEEEVNGQYS